MSKAVRRKSTPSAPNGSPGRRAPRFNDSQDPIPSPVSKPGQAYKKELDMTFRYQRSYRGKIRAVLLDWAGTAMDFGCMAPAVVFMDVFKREGVPITIE